MTDTLPGMTDAEKLEAMVDELATRLTALPEDSFTRRQSPDEWTAAEVVAHMAEMMPYWARVAAAIAREPGSSFGRELDDPDRVGAVTSSNQIPRSESLARLRHAAHEAATAIRGLDASAWEISGKHQTRGEMSIARLIDELLMAHVAAHVQQALTAAGAPPAE
jgi:uncharacterized damage-inducible protein DinB